MGSFSLEKAAEEGGRFLSCPGFYKQTVCEFDDKYRFQMILVKIPGHKGHY